MATLLRLTIENPQNLLDQYGAGATIRIERGTSAAMTDAAEIVARAIVAGRTEDEYRDQTGVRLTHWYRVRYSSGSPAVVADYSDYSAPFQAGALSGELVTIETYKNWAGIVDTDDDVWLTYAVGSMNRCVLRSIGVDIGPSPDTTRTYDGCQAKNGGRRLWIPGGIRAFTTVETSGDGTTWTAVTGMRVGPAAHSRAYGEPGSYIEGTVDLRSSTYVRITGTAFGTFGWDAYPMDLVQAALAALQRMSKDRDGMGGVYPNETDAERYVNRHLVDWYRALYFPLVA